MKILIKESQYVHILENLEKNKKFLTNVMGMDFTGKIKQVTSTYDVPMEFDYVISSDSIRRYLNNFGPMYLFELDGKKYLYLDVGDHEKFIDEDGNIYIDNEIPEMLGIDIMGLRFSDIIDMYFNEEETLNESTDKNKKFLTNHMGIDFTGKIKQITSAYNVPYNFYRNGGISLNHAMSYLNAFGPMYFFELGDYEYLYQDRGNKDWFIDERGVKYIKDEFSERLGLDVLGLRFSDVINMYFNEEETLNESLISEETNKSLKLISKYYDIEGDGATYRGDNKIQTLVTFFPKDYDNEMSDHAGSSICNWEFDPPFDLIFKFMTLPSESFIPLMGYVGNKKDLEEYLEKIHRKEAEKFLVKIKKGSRS
jgi:hypothetical protein